MKLPQIDENKELELAMKDVEALSQKAIKNYQGMMYIAFSDDGMFFRIHPQTGKFGEDMTRAIDFLYKGFLSISALILSSVSSEKKHELKEALKNVLDEAIDVIENEKF